MREKYNKQFITIISNNINNIPLSFRNKENNLVNFSNTYPNDIKNKIIEQIKNFIKTSNIQVSSNWELYYSTGINMDFLGFGSFNNSSKPNLEGILDEFNKEKMLSDFIIFFINNSIKEFDFLNIREKEELQNTLTKNWNKHLKIMGQVIIKDSQHVFSINKINKKNNEILFLMDFDITEKQKYQKIKELSSGVFNCVRIDEILIDGQITTTIFKKMEESSLSVFDITTLNSNVMFELGYAIALNLPIMIISSNANIKLPFNISGLQCIFFNIESGMEELVKKISKKYCNNGSI